MTPIETYSVPAILIAGIVWLALFLKNTMREHREERETWQKSQERQQDETNRNIRENTNVLSALKTIFESRK